MNPFQSLVLSRKFWLLILDTVISLILFFGAKYLTPAALEDVKVLVIALQPVFVTIIAAIAHEDAANVKANALTESAQVRADALTSWSGASAKDGDE